MNSSIYATFRLSLFLTTLCSGMLITSCAASSISNKTSSIAPQRQLASPYDGAFTQEIAVTDNQRSPATSTVNAIRTQLIKKAEIVLTVESIDKSIEAISDIVKQQQGDLLSLQDRKPLNENSRRTASIQIRVPQTQLENTLEILAKLGTLKSRTLRAEDVTSQIVDSDARLRNLRNQESTLQKIMARSGSVGDVLRVAQELGNVRQSIEQIDAQLKSLRNQVAYSTITLNLEEAIATTPTGRSLAVQTQETWNQASHSVGVFTTSLLKLGIWLIAYSPYLLIIAGAIYGYNRLRRRQLRQSP